MGSGILGLALEKTTTSPLHHHRASTGTGTQRLLPFTATSQRHEAAAAAAPLVDDQYSPQQQQQQQQPAPRISQPVMSSSPSPWQRMKWTDNMVRLLIMIVYCVGDDATTAAGGTDQQQHPAASGNKGSNKKASTATSKGKWKSVSRAMMEKGFYVSPQQCEDKFNDLNKRYKRVNELLGKGTACLVVEDQSLLDSLNHLTPKAKEEARKLLNSKHLFFREMCAYHNSASTSTGGGPLAHAASISSPCTTTTTAQLPQPPQSSLPFSLQHQHQLQRCSHHPSDHEALMFGGKLGHSSGSHNDTDGDDDEEVEEDDDYDEDYEDEDQEDTAANHKEQGGLIEEENNKTSKNQIISASPPLTLSLSPSPMEQLRCDLLGSLASVGGEQQQRQWLKRKAAELEEQRVGYQCRALELERQRFKWLRFSTNKEREMERLKLSNERLCLENDRMLLLLRQKEHDIFNN